MGHRWRGYEHPELYTMINDGPGPKASDPQTSYWKDLSTELALVDEELNAKLSTMGASWQGKAAESAQSGLTPLAQWAGDAETGATTMGTSTEYQADYIADARNQMPPPVEVTTPAPSGWDIAGAGAAGLLGNPGPALNVAMQAADHEAQESAQNEAQLEAVRTMESYEKSSTWNRTTLGTFVPPPDVVVSTPPPQGSGVANPVAVGTINTYNAPDGSGSTSPSGYPSTTGSTGSPQVPQVGGNTGGGGGGGGGSTLPPGSQLPPGTTPPGTGTPPGSQLPPGGTTPQNNLPPNLNPNPLPPHNPPVQPNPLPPNNNPLLPPGGRVPSFNDPNNPNNSNKPLVPGPGGRGAFPPGRGVPGMPGFPGGPGGVGGAMNPDGSRPGSQLGRGGLAGAGMPGENSVVRNGPGAASAAGGRGGVNGPLAPGGRRADGEDDDEHFAPDYLLETDDVFGDDRRVAPTVIGE
jgi:hypothetical protein